MNIHYVKSRLEYTIKGKEPLLEKYKQIPELYQTFCMLELNIEELKSILKDVNECIENEYILKDKPCHTH